MTEPGVSNIRMTFFIDCFTNAKSLKFGKVYGGKDLASTIVHTFLLTTLDKEFVIFDTSFNTAKIKVAQIRPLIFGKYSHYVWSLNKIH